MPEIDALSTGKKVGNILNETLKVGGGATTATTPTLTIPRDTATTATVEPLLRLQRTSSGAPAIGIGGSLEFEVETAAANNEIGAVIQAVSTNVTNLTEAFDLVFLTMVGGAAAAERWRMTSAGVLSTSKAADTAVSVFSNTGIGRHASIGGLNLFGGGGTTDNTADINITTTKATLTQNLNIAWTSSSVGAGTTAGMAQKAAGVVEFNNGTKGTYTGTAFGSGTQTIAQLPAAATAGSGARATVSDALAPTFGATVAAGGAITIPVYSDGTNWKVG